MTFAGARFLTESVSILGEPDAAQLDERGNSTGWFTKATVLGRVELGPVTPGGGGTPSRAFVPTGTPVDPGDRLQWEGRPGDTFDVLSVRPRQVPGGPVMFLSLEIA
jgi:hypothetical protein